MYSAYKLNKQDDNIKPWRTLFPYWNQSCSMSNSNYCFLTCIQISQEAGQVVWYSHLFKNFISVIHWLPQVHRYPPSLLYSIHSSSVLCINIFSFLLLSLRNKKCLLLHFVSLVNAQICISPIVVSNVTVCQLLGSQLVGTALNRSIWERGSQNSKTRRNHVPGRENDVDYQKTQKPGWCDRNFTPCEALW